MNFILKNWKKWWFLGGAAITGIIIISAAFRLTGGPNYELTAVVRSNITQTVSVAGKVRPTANVDLALEKSGRVARVYKNIGDAVAIGQIIVQLENGDLTADLAEAEANVKAQQAELEKLKLGARPEEIVIQEAKVADARQTLINKIEDAYTKSDDAVRSKVDQFISNGRVNPQLNLNIGDSKLKIEIEAKRAALEPVLVAWQASLVGLQTSADPLPQSATAKTNLSEVKIFLDQVALAFNNLSAGSGISQTSIDTYRADVSTGRANINTAIASLSTAESNLKIERGQLALDKAGSTNEDILSQQAAVEQAQAKAKNALAQLEKTLIRSPIKGVVTKQEAKVGQIIAANTSVVSVISAGNFEVEANVSEVDVSKVSIMNEAVITLDAYGPEIIFEAKVSRVDPTETIIDGVSAYKTILQLLKEDTRIKSGMTANAEIITSRKENALAVPRRAVSNKGAEKIVKVSRNGQIEEVKVITGISGSNGLIEIISGLNEGEQVVTYSE